MHLNSLGIPLDSEKGQSRCTKTIEEKGSARQLMIPEIRHLTIFHPEKAVLKKQSASFHLAREDEKKALGNEKLVYFTSGLLK